MYTSSAPSESALFPIRDASYRPALLRQLRLPSVALEIMGLGSLLLAYLFAPSFIYDCRAEVIACAGGMVFGILLGYLGRTVSVLNVGAVVCTACASWGFRLITEAAQQSLHWVLPIGAIMTLAIAGTASGPIFFLVLISVTWLLLGVGVVGDVVQFYGSWALVYMVSSVMLGLILCFIFMRLRYGNFLVTRGLEQMAYTDFLTGLPNRRRFLDQLRDTVASSEQAHFLLMLDVDNFKKINDCKGHDAGDAVLVAVGQAVAEVAQASPHGRLGGEEFGLVCSGNEADALRFAHTVLERIRLLNVEQTTVTASIGLASIQASRLNTSFREADLALYHAKSLGKDRAISWHPGMSKE